MQLILFLLGLFAIGCVLYGISAGVQIIVRGFARLTGNKRNNAPSTKPSLKPWTSAPGASPIHRHMDELREIFALYQQGALTREEFENMKRYLLSGIQTDAPQSH